MTRKPKKTKEEEPTQEGPSAEKAASPSPMQGPVEELRALVDERFDEMNEFVQQISDAADSRLSAIEARLHVAPKPGRETYTVVAGDSLAKIAKAHFGNAGRFPEIVTLNQVKYPSLALDPNSLEEGWVLELP